MSVKDGRDFEYGTTPGRTLTECIELGHDALGGLKVAGVEPGVGLGHCDYLAVDFQQSGLLRETIDADGSSSAGEGSVKSSAIVRIISQWSSVGSVASCLGPSQQDKLQPMQGRKKKREEVNTDSWRAGRD